MLRLLLDIHIDPVVAQQMARHRPNCEVVSLRDWREGALRSAADDVILSAAYEEAWTFVTYDQHTVVPLTQFWSQQGVPHAGVIFVNAHKIAQNDIGRVVRALIRFWDLNADVEWQNRIVYL